MILFKFLKTKTNIKIKIILLKTLLKFFLTSYNFKLIENNIDKKIIK